MTLLFRSNILVLAVVGLALTAAALVIWPLAVSSVPGQAIPKSLQRGDQEVAWLNPATSAVNWERFVAAARRFHADRPDLILDDSNAFPNQTTAVPTRVPPDTQDWRQAELERDGQRKASMYDA